MYNRTIPRETIAEMVQQINHTWEIKVATPADHGHHIVYLLDIETGIGGRQCVLKATPPEKPPVCDYEARILAILDAHTSLPIPEVIGVVDEHEDFPAPFFLSPTLPGATYDPSKLVDFSETAIRQLSRSTGRYLAMLHDLDAVDAYGFIDVDLLETLDGGRPSASLDQIVVQDPKRSWTGYLTAEVDRILSILETTQFRDLSSMVRPALEAHIEGLTGEFEPVIARIDQSLDNILVDPETGSVTGLLDWGFGLAATPVYDLVFVEQNLAGRYWTLNPNTPNCQKTIRSAMLNGYREVGSSRIIEQFHENRECYALLSSLHSMLNFEDWFDQAATGYPREAAADSLRMRVENFC